MKIKRVLASAMVLILTLTTALNCGVNFSAAQIKSKTEVNVKSTKLNDVGMTKKKKPILDKGKNLQKSKECAGVNGVQSSPNSITQEFSGIYFSAQDDYVYLPITLASGDILQATLAAPVNEEVDYDLLLYDYDNDELGSLIKQCGLTTYINDYEDGTSKTVGDAISYINTDSESHAYALFVYSTKGYSETEEAKLTVSIDEKGYYDSYEPSDSPFDAATISENADVTGRNLNVSNDQDWFVWHTSSETVASFSVNQSAYGVEVYNASGLSLILRKPNATGKYDLPAGYYYIRVFNNSETFTSQNYTLRVSTVVPNTPKTIKITSFSSDTNPNKVDYGSGSFYRFERNFSVTFKVTDASGNPVSGQTVLLVWQSGSWVEGSANHERRGTAETDANGMATISIEGPPAVGSYSYTTGGPVIIRHYYDIDALAFACGDAVDGVNMYHLAYSMYVDS